MINLLKKKDKKNVCKRIPTLEELQQICEDRGLEFKGCCYPHDGKSIILYLQNGIEYTVRHDGTYKISMDRLGASILDAMRGEPYVPYDKREYVDITSANNVEDVREV